MNVQALDMRTLAKTGPSVGDRWEHLLATRHQHNLVAKLIRFRETLEAEMAPEPWTQVEAPLLLTLSDICDALALGTQEKAEVLGQEGQGALTEALDSHVTLSEERPLNPRQAQELKYARRHGVITQGVCRQLYPKLSSETLRLDLADLVTRGLLRRHGNCRGTYYTVA